VGTFIFTFFIGTLQEVWSSGNWGELISLQVFLSIGLFVFSFCTTPRVTFTEDRFANAVDGGIEW
jgi:hypothetical protein